MMKKTDHTEKPSDKRQWKAPKVERRSKIDNTQSGTFSVGGFEGAFYSVS